MRKAVVKKKYTFAVTDGSGAVTEITVEAESKAAALLLLPGGGDGAVLLSKGDK